MKLMPQLIVASLFAAFGAGSMADEKTPDTQINAATAKSREQVKAELAQARRDGSIKSAAAIYDFIDNAGGRPSMKSREQVRTERAAARASGVYDTYSGSY